MTWIVDHAWWIIGAALLTAAIGLDQAARVARTRRPALDELEADLDALDTPLPPLPAPHLVGDDEDASTRLAESPPPVPAGSAVPDTGAALLYGRTAGLPGLPGRRLTNNQRKRAIKKGRLPRPIPGDLLALLADDAPGEITGPFSITDLGGGVAPAPAAAEHHLPGPVTGCLPSGSRESAAAQVPDRVGESPRPLMVRDDNGRWWPVFPTLYESVAWQARHDATWAELAAMRDDAYAWLDAA